MFKSVFGRLLTTYLIITILVVATLTLVVSSIYKDAIFSEKRNNLEAAAKKVTLLTSDFMNKKIEAAELSAAIDAMGYSTGAIIYALKIDRAKFEKDQAFRVDGLNDTFVPGDILKILDGQTVFRNKQYSEDFGTYVLFIGYPLTVNERNIGAVLLFCPINDINQNVNQMNLAIWLAACLVIIGSMPFIYFNSRRISRPIKQIEIAARKIAAGEKVEDTDIVSDDEIGKLSKSFNAMKDQIELTEKMRRELIANISHDLRTPLTSINGFIQGMLEGIIKPEDQFQYLKIIQEETNRLIRMTSDILDLAKIESGSINLKIEEINLKGVVDAAISSLRFKAQSKNITFFGQGDPDIRVLADAEKLMQILSNILGNAIKYTAEGGNINITSENQGEMIRISVRDDGIGISQDNLPFIFEKFFRADQSRQTDEDSTGLGLSIVKNLVALSGGNLGAESEIGVGTTVYFTLPSVK